MLDQKTLESIDSEIRAGLPHERDRLQHCEKSTDYYELRGLNYLPYREAENDYDYQIRPKKSLPFTRRVVDVLTTHLYGPGPSRTIQGEPDAAAWLNGAYADNLVNSLWQRADRFSTLNGVAAFQVAWTGVAAHPLRIQLWPRAQFVAYPDPNDATRASTIITIDKYDEKTRYTWWTNEWYRVYETPKLYPGQTSGGREPKFRDDLSGTNPYGLVPFSLIHFDLPVTDWDTKGLGDYLAHINGQIDVEASELAEAVQKYHKPLPVAYDCDIQWNVAAQPGKFIRVNAVPTDLENKPSPRLEYLQAGLDIAGGWESIRSTINTTLDGIGVPMTAYRLEQGMLPSGIALVAEQAPLLSRAKERQEPFRSYETGLARVGLAIGAKMTGRADLARAAADPIVLCAWPEPSIPIPGPDRDAADQAEIELGISSTVMLVQRRYGLTREQALAHIKQVAKDNAELATIFPDGVEAPGIKPDPQPRPETDPEPEPEPDDDPVDDPEDDE